MCKIYGQSGYEAGVALPPASKESRMTYHGIPIAWTWIIRDNQVFHTAWKPDEPDRLIQTNARYR